MTQLCLGRRESALLTRTRLREAMKQPRWANDTDARAFAGEAEQVFAGER